MKLSLAMLMPFFTAFHGHSVLLAEVERLLALPSAQLCYIHCHFKFVWLYWAQQFLAILIKYGTGWESGD
jgi:hypothetical protein